VAQGDSLHRERAVLVNDGLPRRIHRMELYLVAQVTTEGIHLHLQDSLKPLVGMYVQAGGAPQETESGNHAYQPEAVVAVQMRDEHMANLREAHPATAQLQLGAFTAVNHEQFLTNLNDLR